MNVDGGDVQGGCLLFGRGREEEAATTLADGLISGERNQVEFGMRAWVVDEVSLAILAAHEHHAVLGANSLADGRRYVAHGKADARPH